VAKRVLASFRRGLKTAPIVFIRAHCQAHPDMEKEEGLYGRRPTLKSEIPRYYLDQKERVILYRQWGGGVLDLAITIHQESI